jgi:NAD(P)-dependent dehydrogenase (short-subunit alcohol dehydrogenase family)
MSELEGQVAVVTGGGRGVGRAVAQALATAGAAVAVVGRTERDVNETAASIEGAQGRSLALTADVTREHEVADALDETVRRLGAIDLLVNNAGSCDALGPVWEVDPDLWWRDVEVNLRGTFLCSRAVLPSMIERGAGRIINFSTYGTIRPDPYRSAYASAKLAVARFTDTLAAELTGRGVFVFVMTPGTIHTRMIDSLAAAAAERNWPVDWPDPATRTFLPPERAGELVVFLGSGRADALAGRFLHPLDDVADLARRAEEVVEQDLYAVRLRKP